MDLSNLRIGYVPYSKNYDRPGDRRRFVHYAKSRGLSFEVADPSKKYDLVVLSQAADLSVWPGYDCNGQTKIVYEAINSYLAVPKTEIKGRLRGLAKYLSGKSRFLRFDEWKAIESMCLRADAVICSTEEQEKDISEFCNNVHIILDIHSSVSNSTKKEYKSHSVFNLVWEGMGDNAFQLQSLKNVFSDLQKRHEIALHLVTDLSYRKYLGKYGNVNTRDIVKGLCKRVYLHEWSELKLSEVVCSSDLAIIPVDRTNPLVTGKPENKLLLFWRMGMPTVTSATPAYDRAMAKASLCMSCSDEKQWIEKIEEYIVNEKLRRRDGLVGNKITKQYYSEEATLKQWDDLFKSLFT